MRAFEPPNPPLTASSIQFTQVDFYNDIRAYLSELQNTTVRSLDDMVAFNDQYTASEGGEPVSQFRGLCRAYAHSRRVGLWSGQGTAAAFASGQDAFLASLGTVGIQNSTYQEALVRSLHLTCTRP